MRLTAILVLGLGALVLAALAIAAASPSLAVGWWADVVRAIQLEQQAVHRQLADALHAVAAHGAGAAWGLVTLSFVYGILHAAGPGHGKVVISTYLLTNESRFRRGLVLSSASALMQGVTAIVLVEVFAWVMGLGMRQAQTAGVALEGVSYGMVALIGLVLAYSCGRRLLIGDHHHGPHHGAHHGNEHHSDGCGHAHGPSMREIAAAHSWWKMAGLVAAVGLRPCTGAILVLLVAHAMGLGWAGVVGVLAMSAGTAMTVAGLATLAVTARNAALRLADMLPGQTSRATRALEVVGLLGGLLIATSGAMLLYALSTAPRHPLL